MRVLLCREGALCYRGFSVLACLCAFSCAAVLLFASLVLYMTSCLFARHDVQCVHIHNDSEGVEGQFLSACKCVCVQAVPKCTLS